MDRKAFWISGLLLLAMTGATFWRLSLLPDWHHIPADGPASERTISLFWLFWVPCGLLFTMAMLPVRRWLVSGSPEAMQAWRRYRGGFLIFYSAILSLMQAFILARSLGLAAEMDRLAAARFFLFVAGIAIMVLGNALPKMPFLTARLRFFRLDPWQWNRQLRFTGKLMVGMGLFLAIGLQLLPLTLWRPAIHGVFVAYLAALLWHRAMVKRQPSALP